MIKITDFLCKMMSFKKRCCDPFNLKKCTKQLLNIRPSVQAKLEKLNVEGTTICSSCNIKVSTMKNIEPVFSPAPSIDDTSQTTSNNTSSSDSADESGNDTDQESKIESNEYERAGLIDSLNQNILPALGLSPMKVQIMSSEKYAIQKIQQLTSSLEMMFGSGQKVLTSNELERQKAKAEQFDVFIAKLKTKFQCASTKNEKYQILTLLPMEWSARKIEAEFGCSFYLANSCKKLQEQKGALSVPNSRLPSNILQKSTKEAVVNFYLEDDISRVMPGKNDCVSIAVNGNNCIRWLYCCVCVVRPSFYV